MTRVNSCYFIDKELSLRLLIDHFTYRNLLVYPIHILFFCDSSISSVFAIVVRDITSISIMQSNHLLPHITLDEVKIRGWDYAVDSIVITATRKKWDGKNESTPILYVNTSFEEMTGYTAREVLGKDPRFLQGELTDRNVIRDIQTALRDNTVFRGETYNYKKDGTPFIMSWHIEPVRDEHKTIIAYLAIQRDMTELRKLEQQKNELLAIKTNFVRVVSHQLRTPLTAAKWSTEMALEEQNKSAQEELLKTTLTGLERLAQRVQTMLLAMDIPDDLNEAKPRPYEKIQSSTVFQGVIDGTAYIQKEKQVSVSEAGKSIPFEVNKDILELALYSIVMNAIVYSHPGCEVRLSAKKVKNTAILEVADSGIGITEADTAALWTAFVRGEEASKKWTDGFGAELWIVKKNIESVGGSIEIESAGRDKGTTVRIIVPN